MKPLVSIIVPVYQTEAYIRVCIESILRQNWKDWELLLINDGSTDESGRICDYYAGNDPRIRVFHQINSGVSAARNKGLEEARGEYIMFVDADDWIEQSALTILLDTARKYHLSIIQFGVKSFVSSNDVIINDVLESKVQVYQGLKDYDCFQCGVWGYLLHRDVCASKRFTIGVRYAEDIEFITKCIASVSALGVLLIDLYHLRLHESSAMSRLATYDQVSDHLIVIRNLSTYAHDKTSNEKSFIYKQMNRLVKSYFSFFIKNDVRPNELKRMNQDFRSIYPLLHSCSLKDLLMFSLAALDVRIYIKLLRLFVFSPFNKY